MLSMSLFEIQSRKARVKVGRPRLGYRSSFALEVARGHAARDPST
jgi:hypothetical protein